MNQSLVSQCEQRNASAVIDEQIAHTEANLAKLERRARSRQLRGHARASDAFLLNLVDGYLDRLRESRGATISH